MASSSHAHTTEASPESRALSAVAIAKVGLAVLLLAGIAWLVLRHREWFEDPKLIKSEVTVWGAWAPVLYIVLYAIGPSLLLPGAVMTIAGGLAFGTLWGSVYAVAGAFAGALIAFAAGRFLGHEFVGKATGKRFRKTLDRIAKNGFRIILYLRIFPVIPYNALNLIAGASPITFRDYFWASMFGLLPGTIIFAFLGNELWHPGSPRFFLALGLLAACLGAGELYRRFAVQEVID